MGQRDNVLHGSTRPVTVKRDRLYVQHAPDSNEVLALWCGAKNDERRCLVNKATRNIDDDYEIQVEDATIIINEAADFVELQLPNSEDVISGHTVVVLNPDEANIDVVAVETHCTINGKAFANIATTRKHSLFVYDKVNNNWIAT